MKIREAKCDNDQLICCMHGPAGCGKSTVIELVMEYAREYCPFLPHVTFTARMIVVTAMTGVAATIDPWSTILKSTKGIGTRTDRTMGRHITSHHRQNFICQQA